MIHVALGERSYDISISSGQGDIAAFISERIRGRSAFLVADTHTARYGRDLAAKLGQLGFRCESAEIAAGEQSKSLVQAETLYSRLAEMPADRLTTVIAVGGGVIGDLAGFVAATYNRGLPLIMVPTSLLAMVDSAVGGKVGINLPQGKNLVGAFHQPVGVWIDTEYLKTLPDREFRSGLAEVVKYGMALDAAFFAWLEANAAAILRRDSAATRHIITRSCELKARIVERDERELLGQRIALNFGHTFAHAFETVAGYDGLSHGEAVGIGMVCACRLAERRTMIAPEVTSRLIHLLSGFGLPTGPPPDLNLDECLAIMRRDKKNVAGRMRFVLPRQIGQVAPCEDMTENDLRSCLVSDPMGNSQQNAG